MYFRIEMLKISTKYFIQKIFKCSQLYSLVCILLFFSTSSFSQIRSGDCLYQPNRTVFQQQHQFDAPSTSENYKLDVEAMLEDSEDEDENEKDQEFYPVNGTCLLDSYFDEFVYTSFINTLFSSLLPSAQEKAFVPIFVYQHSWKRHLS